jgi:hypothetical protein
MELASKTVLAAKKEAFRLWFEYLSVARQSPKKEIRSALVVSQPFYEPWTMDRAGKFDSWWKDHNHLFQEEYVVRELKIGEAPIDPEALLIEVPLTCSPTELTKKVKIIIEAAFNSRNRKERKGKKTATAHYRLTQGSEPKLDAVREMLTVYRDIYLRNPTLRGEKLLDATHRFYLGRKNKRWAKVPLPLVYSGDGDKIRAMRNLRRYIQKAERIVLNVARGQFPGDY